VQAGDSKQHVKENKGSILDGLLCRRISPRLSTRTRGRRTEFSYKRKEDKGRTTYTEEILTTFNPNVIDTPAEP